MIVEQLQALIKTNNFDGFKTLLKSQTVNAHHNALLFEISYRQQKKEFFEYMGQRISLSAQQMTDILLKTLVERTVITDRAFLPQVNDHLLCQQMSSLHVDCMLKHQSHGFLKDFVNQFPLTTYMKFKNFIFMAFKNGNEDFCNLLVNLQLTKDLLFYVGLCAFKFEQKDLFSQVLSREMKRDIGLHDEMRKLSEKYINMARHGKAKEEFEKFINVATVEALSKHLQSTLVCHDSKVRKKSKL